MSLDEKLFGWVYEKIKKPSPTAPSAEVNWNSVVRRTEIIGSLLINDHLRIEMSKEPKTSKTNLVYFTTPCKEFPEYIAERFLWLKVLFHSACVISQVFWDSKISTISENIGTANRQSDEILKELDPLLPAASMKLVELTSEILNYDCPISKRWQNFIKRSRNQALAPIDQLAFWSIPSREKFESMKSKSSPSTTANRISSPPAKNGTPSKDIKTDAELEIIELKTENQNPLVHVFEKVFAADNYSGGSRPQEDSDEKDLLSASTELKVDKLIRTSKQIHGQISADLDIDSPPEIEPSEELSDTVLAYPEWFTSEQQFRADWCVLHERTPRIQNASLANRQSLASPSKLRIIRALKSEIEIAFQKERWLNRQKDGPEIDIDSFIRARSSPDCTESKFDRIYIRRHKQENDFAILLLLDASASTDSWVANRRVLDELKLVIEILAEVFKDFASNIAMSTFSSDSRLRCSYEWIKTFDEPWNNCLTRMKSIEPRGYTRMGVALRHSQRKLLEIQARRRGILLLTDAKPTDFDHYEGRHGRGDVRKALDELAAAEIQSLSLIVSPRKERAFYDLFGMHPCQVVQNAEQIGSHFVQQFVSLIEA